MIALLLLVLLVASVVAFVRPDLRRQVVLNRIGLGGGDRGTETLVNVINGLVVVVLANWLLGGFVAFLAAIALLVYSFRDRLPLR